MAMGKRRRERQQELWIAAPEMPEAQGHPFDRRLDRILADHGFDAHVDGICRRFYTAGVGRRESRTEAGGAGRTRMPSARRSTS